MARWMELKGIKNPVAHIYTVVDVSLVTGDHWCLARCDEPGWVERSALKLTRGKGRKCKKCRELVGCSNPKT